MPERYVRSGKARLWTCSTGAGTPFLMFNGGPGCNDYLAPVAVMIEDMCEVVRFEPRGCGRSDWDGRYDVDTLLDDAEAVRDAYGIERCIVGGHSFGPSVALAYALRYPDRALGVVGIAGGTVVNDRAWSAAYHRNRSRVGEDLGGAVFTRPGRQQDWQPKLAEYIKRPELFREIADLPVPATFHQWLRGHSATAGRHASWRALIPNGRYVEIAGAAHRVWLDACRRNLRTAMSRGRRTHP